MVAKPNKIYLYPAEQLGLALKNRALVVNAQQMHKNTVVRENQ